MIKQYAIQFFNEGKSLQNDWPMELDKNNFNDMISLVGIISDELLRFEFESDLTDVEVKVCSDDDFIFRSTEEYRSYLTENKIEHKLRSNFSLQTYVNQEPYYYI